MIITASKLNSLNLEYKKKFEEILPELIKKLIVSSAKDTVNVRMPSGNDIWAPGFDGVIDNKVENNYVASGISVWEFGTSDDTLKKINEDYNKRTKDSLGIDKKQSTFYLVTPKIWAYDNHDVSITDWSSNKTDWKKVCVYDAIVICDWLKKEPSVCAWLLEELFLEKNVDFNTVKKAWDAFSHKTDPCFTKTMFLIGRESKITSFHEAISKKNIIRVKSRTQVDALGFCLSVILQNDLLSNNIVVVNNINSYKVLDRICKDKIFLLNFYCEEDASDRNKVILCFNTEATTVSADIELMPLTKSQYDNALRDMKIDDHIFSEISLFTNGNLLSLIRKIPGSTNISKPSWTNSENCNSLIPLMFLRVINTKKDYDRELIEYLSGEEYYLFENKIEAFLKMEDSPVKRVNDYYAIINYEEVWLTLKVPSTSIYFKRLSSLVLELFKTRASNQVYDENREGKLKHLNNILLNYIYFRETNNDNVEVDNFVKDLMQYYCYDITRDYLNRNLSLLAEASPNVIMTFIETELRSEKSNILQLFQADDYSDKYCSILYALDILVLEMETKIKACNILFKLYVKTYNKKYRISNSPKESLLKALCLWDIECVLLLDEKKRLILRYMDIAPQETVTFVQSLIVQQSISKGIRLGAKRLSPCESITTRDLVDAKDEIIKKAFHVSQEHHQINLVLSVINHYYCFYVQTINELADLFSKASFCQNDIAKLNFAIRKVIHDAKKFNRDSFQAYEGAIGKWLSVTTDTDLFYKNSWAFNNFYDCPYIEGVKYYEESNYSEERETIKKIRIQLYGEIQSVYGDATGEIFANYLEDDYRWGAFLAESLGAEEFDTTIAICLKRQKYALVSGIVDYCSEIQAKTVLKKLPEKVLRIVLSKISRTDVQDFLEDENDEKAYWKTKRMDEYDEFTYGKLLKYNPIGLLSFYAFKDNEDYKYDGEKIIEILSEINKQSDLDKHIVSLSKYEIEDVIKKLDNIFYSDDFAKICFSLLIKEIIEDIPECVKKYFFVHPQEISNCISTGHSADEYWFFNSDYCLPMCAYDDFSSFSFFCETVSEISSERVSTLGDSIVGAILGRESKRGNDNIYPHEFVRAILEKNNERINNNFLISRFNAQGMRSIGDGTDQFEKSKMFFDFSQKIEIEYPITAQLLRNIGNDYFSEGKHDQSFSEIGMDAY